MTKCSIIIPVYNRVSLTRQCLQAIQDNTSSRVAHEIIVADDGSTDSTPQFLANYGDQIRVVTMPTNSGCAAACNEGAATATGEYLVFLNNDTIAQVGWLETLVDYAATHHKAAVIGSKLLFPDGTVQSAGIVIHRNRYPFSKYRGFPKDHPAVNKSRRFQLVCASCVLIRREWFKQLGGFDPTFRNGYEDIDFCLRVGERGGEIHYCHQSVLLHLESASREDSMQAEFARTEELYLSRWATRVQPDDLVYYLEDGLLSFRHVYDLIKEKAFLSVRLLKAKLRASTNSGNTTS